MDKLALDAAVAPETITTDPQDPTTCPYCVSGTESESGWDGMSQVVRVEL